MADDKDKAKEKIIEGELKRLKKSINYSYRNESDLINKISKEIRETLKNFKDENIEYMKDKDLVERLVKTISSSIIAIDKLTIVIPYSTKNKIGDLYFELFWKAHKSLKERYVEDQTIPPARGAYYEEGDFTRTLSEDESYSDPELIDNPLCYMDDVEFDKIVKGITKRLMEEFKKENPSKPKVPRKKK